MSTNFMNPSFSKEEVLKWREIRYHIHKRLALEVCRYIAYLDSLENPEYDGSLSFWGIKRLIMMLEEEDWQNNIVYQNLSQRAKDYLNG